MYFFYPNLWKFLHQLIFLWNFSFPVVILWLWICYHFMHSLGDHFISSMPLIYIHFFYMSQKKFYWKNNLYFLSQLSHYFFTESFMFDFSSPSFNLKCFLRGHSFFKWPNYSSIFPWLLFIAEIVDPSPLVWLEF